MKIGIIGMGRAGRRYHDIASKNGHQAVGWDVRDDLSCGLSSGEFLKAVDAVVVATPPATHIDWLVQCSIHRKPVMVEKPLADAVPDPALLLATLVVPVTTYRFHPTVWLARFENPEPRDVRIVYRDHIDNWQAETYERDADLEARIHFVDLLYWIGGPSMARRHRDLLTLDYETPGERRCELFMDGKPYELKAEQGAHVAQFRHFVNCVETGDEPVCTLGEALEVLGICLNH